MPRSRPRLLAYSHDGYGLGHLRRNLRIAIGLRRLRPDVEVLLATGAKGAELLTGRHGVACVALPPVVKAGAGRYLPADGGSASIDELVARRSQILAGAVADFGPDLLLADRHPRGLHRELDAALAAHRRGRPGARAVLGLRDILDEPVAIGREWSELELATTVAEHYDAVLCYGDAAVYDLTAEYALPEPVTERLSYTGYLADDLLAENAATIRQAHARGGRLAVCTLGGGQDAAAVARAFLDAIALLREQGWRGVLIAGPYMPDADIAALHARPGAADVAIIPMTTDVPGYLAAADAVLCMGGYNTTCEVLALAVPAVVVPRIRPRREQLMRAQRLADRGLLRWLHPDGLTPHVVAAALAAAADAPRKDLLDRLNVIDRDGVRTTARLLSRLLSRSVSIPTAQEAARATR